jgi:DNA-binding transcriptional regulator YhcF (GntR family)
MNIELKDRSHNPVYLQVREQIETQIRNKIVKSGETLPSPAALAQKLSVDKGEIQRAYFELEQLGLITKHSGKDFLGKPKIDYHVAGVDRSS